MRKSYLLLLAFLCFATFGFAQFKINTNTNIGQTYTIDSLNGLPTGEFAFLVHFNTKIPSSSYTATAAKQSNCQTQRGLQVKVYTTNSGTGTINGIMKCDNYGGYSNPCHVASLDSMKAWVKKNYELVKASANQGDTSKLLPTLPQACLFDVVKGDTTNQAFGCYPGKYKRIEYGFQFDFTGSALKSDVSFNIDTYDAGTAGKPAVYKLTAYAGGTAASNLLGTVDSFYVTGSGKKTFNLAGALGLDYTALSKKKVYFFIGTTGTDTIPNESVTEPIIIIDDLSVRWGSAKWTAPAAKEGDFYNKDGAGLYSFYTFDAASGVGTVQIKLKDEGRVGQLMLTNSVESPPSRYQFLDSLGVFANDGNGNYTVPVSYKKYPSVIDAVSGNYTKSYITIPAPATSANDDIMVLMTFKPSATADFTERVEITNSSVRFWWDVQTMGSNMQTALDKSKLETLSAYSQNGSLFIQNAESPVTLYNILGQRLGTWTSEEAARGISAGRGLILISTSAAKAKVMVH